HRPYVGDPHRAAARLRAVEPVGGPRQCGAADLGRTGLFVGQFLRDRRQSRHRSAVPRRSLHGRQSPRHHHLEARGAAGSTGFEALKRRSATGPAGACRCPRVAHDSGARRVYRRALHPDTGRVSGAGQNPVSIFMTGIASAPAGSETPVDGSADARSSAGLWGLALGSIGVVYGDIGTSPLYAFRVAITAASASTPGELPRETVLGVVSLILWALFIVVTLKYVLILLRADNNGEGGTLTLMALASRAVGRFSKAGGVVALLGIISAALFYGDAVITPALSVLSAVEGLDVATPAFHAYVVPLTIVILLVLFAFQSSGTAKVAALFGPVMAVWFVAIAIPGVMWIAADPGILWALNPFHGVYFLLHHGMIGLVTLGAVFLAVTGAEALYADLGHFGRGPIQLAWLCLVLPALALNYLGQGALVYAHPEAIENPFFLMYPDWALIPMVVLATAATVIASQAVITGAYSLTSQAIQLGLLPRFEIRHTSARQAGQIYMPRVNGLLLTGVLLLVALFRSSSALASAYGIAVTGTMVVTCMMAFIVIWRLWRWSAVAAA